MSSEDLAWVYGNEFAKEMRQLEGLDNSTCPDQVSLASDFRATIASVNTTDTDWCGKGKGMDSTVQATWETLDAIGSLADKTEAERQTNSTTNSTSNQCGPLEPWDLQRRLTSFSSPIRELEPDCNKIE